MEPPSAPGCSCQSGFDYQKGNDEDAQLFAMDLAKGEAKGQGKTNWFSVSLSSSACNGGRPICL